MAARAAQTRRRRASRSEPAAEGGSIWTLVGRISAILGLIAAAVGLLFTFVPDLRPVGRPTTVKAELRGLQVEPGLSFRQYLQRIDQDPGSLDEKTLSRRGVFFEFDIVTTGLREDPLALKAELVDAGTGDEVGQELSTTVTPQANEDAIAWHDFLPYPAKPVGPFVARIELFDPKGVPLARTRSQPFRPFPGR